MQKYLKEKSNEDGVIALLQEQKKLLANRIKEELNKGQLYGNRN